MVSRLVDEDVGNRTSEEEIVSGSEGPAVSERVQMATAISRPTTAQMVLGQEALYLPDDHPLLRQIQSSVTIQGRVLVNSDGPALTHLELTIHMADDCQGHSSLDAPSELNPPQRIPSPLFIALLVPQAEG